MFLLLIIIELRLANPLRLLIVKLNKPLDLALTGLQTPKIKIKTSGHNPKNFLLIFLTVNLETINQANLISDDLMVGQMVNELLIDRTVLVLGPGLLPTEMVE